MGGGNTVPVFHYCGYSNVARWIRLLSEIVVRMSCMDGLVTFEDILCIQHMLPVWDLVVMQIWEQHDLRLGFLWSCR